MKNIDNIIAKLDDFPTLPTIYSSLLAALSNPRSTVQDIANIVSKDQASVAKLLRVVNSPIFGFKSRVDTVTQAIFLIGFNELRNLILALSVMKIFTDMKGTSEFNVVDLWKHSIAVAVITRLLGQNLGIKNIENYFISGLMHDMGKLVFYKLFPSDFIEAVNNATENNISISKAEKAVFGIDHSLAGDLLAEKWKLPSSIRNCIRAHHRGTVDGNVDQITACVHLANILASVLELGNPGDTMVEEPNYRIWKELNFKEGTIRSLYEQIMIQYEQSYAILKID